MHKKGRIKNQTYAVVCYGECRKRLNLRECIKEDWPFL